MPQDSGGLLVLEAEPGDLQIVLGILKEATEWLRSKGIDQWRPEFFSPAQIMRQVEKGEVYLARLDGRVVGTITLQWSDPRFWGQTPSDAGYVHRLAVRRVFAGRGLGRLLLEWALKRAQEAGRRYMRLNCMFENPRLRRYYEDVGFNYRGEVRLQGLRFALYEKQL